MFVVCCTGTGIYGEVITLSENSYGMCVGDVETLTMRRPRPELGPCGTERIYIDYQGEKN
jgi:hypothetical protein